MGLHLSTGSHKGSRARTRGPVNIAAIGQCAWWIDCAATDNIEFGMGMNVTRVMDRSGHNRHMTKIGAGNETVFPTYDDSRKAVRFMNTAFDQMIAGARGDWNFLHNGTGCTILLMVEIDAVQAANAALLSTSSEASSGIGTNIWYHNASQNYNVTTRNGSAQSFYSSGPANSLQKGLTRIIAVRIENRAGVPSDLVTRINGVTDIETNIISALSSGDSTGPLFIGKLAEGVFAPRFYLKKCALFSRRLHPMEEHRIVSDWADSEGLDIPAPPRVPLVVLAGQSNARGRGAIADTIYESDPLVDNAFIFNPTTFAWQNLQAGVTNAAYDTDSLGLEMALADSYTAAHNTPFFLVKYTADGTPMTSWASDNSNTLNLKQAMQRAYWKLTDMGYAPQPHIIWYQGESDALNTDLANAYATRLSNFFTDITDMDGYRQARRYIVQTHQEPFAVATETVRAAQRIVAMTLPHSRYSELIVIDDIAEHTDQHHVTADTLNALGMRIANLF